LPLAACAAAPSSKPGADEAPKPTEAPASTPKPTEAPALIPEPTETPEPEDPDVTVFENLGLKLKVPNELVDKLILETKDEPLFTATEIASKEAAEKTHPEYADGMGWLFGISRVTEDKLHEMLTYVMFGQKVFARDDSGCYYILSTPTDVRIDREGEITESDLAQWSAFYKWINGSMCERFIADNGLTPCRISNTDLDIELARIAWKGETAYTLASLADGVHGLGNADGAAAAGKLLSACFFEMTDEEIPDGEYLVLQIPDSRVRFDFFYAEVGRLVREYRDDMVILYRCKEDVDVTALVEQWYEALPRCAQTYDADAYRKAKNDLLSEYIGLDQAALENYDDDAHPELPRYTAVVANPVRNSLYYALYDFDGNAVPELVIAAGDEDYQQPMGIYAFDGEKMVYLCRQMPLGERCTLSYFEDGLFAVQGSGGAAVGSVALYRIAPDGYSTELIEIMDYEYRDENTVTYTPELGNMSPQEFEQGDYLRGFDVPLYFKLFVGKRDRF
ncbi:MAG: hypothetical protein Q4E45_10255, partial [Eubacteriales bacterium]|nr:hypothetical protein [Eubacteriales bacterium]